LLFVIASALYGCTVKTVEAPVTVTTKILPELPAASRSGKVVVGSSCARAVLFIIPVGIATAESAYADALAQAPGTDTLVSYEARATNLFVFPFYYEVCTEVHGIAVSAKSLGR
jgi:hypothetical protein